MMKRLLPFIAIAVALAFLPSCKTLYPNRMFQQGDYQYFELAQKQLDQYVLKPGDVFTLKVYARDGFKLIDVLGMSMSDRMAGLSQGNTVDESAKYQVDVEGFAKLPILGQFYVKGFTEAELERMLAEKYAGLFVDPYVIVRASNRRVFVFKGSLGQVVPLNETPTSLIEVIAAAGGLEEGTKAYNIKIIRGDLQNPQISLVDLSTIEGMRKAELAMQTNDIVCIDKRRKVVSDVLREAAPYFSLITTVSTLIFLVIRLGK